MISVWAVSTLTMLALAGILPDFQLQADDGDTVTRTAFTAAWGAGAFGLLSALVWPVLVRALLIVPALVLGALVFFLNGSLLLIALRLIPDGRGDANPETAVVVAAVMSAVASATSTALAVRDDDAYRRRLSRLADRRRRRSGMPRSADGERGGPPGIVFVQLDGVGHDVLERAAAAGIMPTVAGLLADEAGHRLTPWTTDWSSQTGASQLGILHGSNFDVPAFRWFEKETGTVMVSSRPASALELQRRAIARTHDGGLLTVDGASRGNLFSGGAEELALVLSMAARLGKGRGSRAGYFAYFSDPANAVRTALSFVAEVVREIGQSVRARVRKESPRVKRGGLYPFIRAFATVVERDVVVAAVIGDMFAGRTAVYADLVAYDEVAHHSGPHSRDAEKVLTRLDRSLGLMLKIADHTPAPTGSCSCRTTARARARPSRDATASPSRTSYGPAAGCPYPAGRNAPAAPPRPATPCASRCTGPSSGSRRRSTPPSPPTRSCSPPEISGCCRSPTSRGGPRASSSTAATPPCSAPSPPIRGSASCSYGARSTDRWCSGGTGPRSRWRS